MNSLSQEFHLIKKRKSQIRSWLFSCFQIFLFVYFSCSNLVLIMFYDENQSIDFNVELNLHVFVWNSFERCTLCYANFLFHISISFEFSVFCLFSKFTQYLVVQTEAKLVLWQQKNVATNYVNIGWVDVMNYIFILINAIQTDKI